MKVSAIKSVEMDGKTKIFAIAKGKLTVDGEPMKLKPSDNKNYPTLAGWFEFKTDSFIQISSSEIKVEAKVGSKMTPLTVKDPEPVPPETSKSILCFSVLFLEVAKLETNNEHLLDEPKAII